MSISVYTRLSEDPSGQALGVGRQEEDCRALARLRGWDVAAVYCDNDVSAYKRKVVRPEFEHLLTDLRDGVVDGIVAYDLDRLARQPVDLERIISIYDARPGLVFATVQGDIDLSTPDGRTMTRVLVAFANKSSMDTSRRIKRKHLELAQKGVPVGGHRPFGYKADKRTLEPREAAQIRRAAADILSGVGVQTIVRRWNAEGITTTVGNPWRRSVLRNMMLSPRLAGFRVYQGGIAKDADGKPVRGLVAPVLDADTWEAVRALLTDPARSGPNVHSGGRKYLLSGVARCALCAGLLCGNADTRWNTFSYACKNFSRCGRVAISGPKLDALITELVLRYLNDRETQPQGETWSGEGELAETTSRVSELMKAYASGELSSDVVFPTVSKLEDRSARLRAAKAAWIREQVAVTSRPSNAAGMWPSLETEQRRAVIHSVLQSVAIKPAAAPGGRFDPGRAEPIWR